MSIKLGNMEGACELKERVIEYNLRVMFYGDLTWLKGLIIHELCHLLVRDHTKEFWTLYDQKIKEAGIVEEGL